VARTWQRLGLLALCALLLAAQQQLRMHALSHLGDAHATAAAAPAKGHDHESGPEATACTLCLAGAAAANLMPATAGLGAQHSSPWWAPAAALAPAERRASAATRHIRGPPLPPRLG
jgi:hypothetical protein